MNHLTVDEMIDFVSLTDLDKESLALASKVNSHISRCRECREKVKAFQTVYDGLIKMERINEVEEITGEREILEKKTEQTGMYIDRYL